MSLKLWVALDRFSYCLQISGSGGRGLAVEQTSVHTTLRARKGAPKTTCGLTTFLRPNASEPSTIQKGQRGCLARLQTRG